MRFTTDGAWWRHTKAGAERGHRGEHQDFGEMLRKYGVEHTFEIYEGTHTSGVAKHIETQMLPFFSANLSFDQPRH